MATAAAAQTYLRIPCRVLIASADPIFRRRVMDDGDGDSRYEEAGGGAHALFKLREIECDRVLLDRCLPDLDSSELATLIERQYPHIEVRFIDARIPAVIGENSKGTYQLTSMNGQWHEEDHSQPSAPIDASQEAPLAGMIGTSLAMQRVYRLARLVANRDTAVLITGETGTGKELVAEAIHQLSGRSHQPFVVVNCAAIPEALFESELFGHARGAFTGASQSRLGRIHTAQGGTLFLDEIGELPLSMQGKLLRFLQNGEVQKLGSLDLYRVDVRVICATNVRLAELVAAKQFREDLLYRIAVFPIEMPPLRERIGDVAALATHFLSKLCANMNDSRKYLSASAFEFLERLHWPGNVRELQHRLERAFILSGSEAQISRECLGEFLGMRGLRES